MSAEAEDLQDVTPAMSIRWASLSAFPPMGLPRVSDLEAQGWKRAGAHPLYQDSVLMWREAGE